MVITQPSTNRRLLCKSACTDLPWQSQLISTMPFLIHYMQESFREINLWDTEGYRCQPQHLLTMQTSALDTVSETHTSGHDVIWRTVTELSTNIISGFHASLLMPALTAKRAIVIFTYIRHLAVPDYVIMFFKHTTCKIICLHSHLMDATSQTYGAIPRGMRSWVKIDYSGNCTCTSCVQMSLSCLGGAVSGSI